MLHLLPTAISPQVTFSRQRKIIPGNRLPSAHCPLPTFQIRKIITILLTILLSAVTCLLPTFSFTQTPQAIKYQAIARNPSGAELINSNLSVRILIHDITPTGTVIYNETHSVTTNDFGLFNINIGEGISSVGTFSGITWASGSKFIEQEIDFGGGYQSMGTTQLMSVPYALYAEKSGSNEGWSFTGNEGTNDSSNFIGTKDEVPLNFRVNNERSGRIEMDSSTANTFLGFRAGNDNIFGTANTAIGYEAFQKNTNGKNNLAIGSHSLQNNIAGHRNVSLGNSALYSNSTGSDNIAIGINALGSNKLGSDNIAIGNSSLYFNTEGDYNTAFGFGALKNNASGGNNTAVGTYALQQNYSGSNNTALGFQAGVFNLWNPEGQPYVPIYNATAIGANAKVAKSNSLVLGNNVNVGIGTIAPSAKLEVIGQIKITGGSPGQGKVLTSDSAGLAKWENTATIGGGWSLSGNSGMNDTVNFIGTTDNVGLNFRVNNQRAGMVNESQASTFLGYLSGGISNTGVSNSAIGMYSLINNTTGNNNSAFGVMAITHNTTGNYNTAIGTSALYHNFTGNNNTAIGHDADVSTGNLNNATAIGANALVSASNSLVLGSNANVGIGTSAPTAKLEVAGQVKITGGSPGQGKILTSDSVGLASWQTPSGNVSGWSLTGNAGMIDTVNFIGTTDSSPLNIRVGNQKAGRIDQWLGSTFWGYKAGNANTVGINNIAIGNFALLNNSTGNANTAVGVKALYYNTYGNNNTAIGVSALISNTTGTQNTAVGMQALISNITGNYNTSFGTYSMDNNIIGNFNTANGHQALISNLSGNYNTAMGTNALYSNTKGSGNTALGYYSNVAYDSLNNATAIGSNSLVSSSNSLVLGNNANVGIGTSAPTAKLEVVGQVKITGGSPGQGKILTADSAGLASWQTPSGNVSGWSLTGNAGMNDTVNFIGTTDNVPLNFRVNNQIAGRIDEFLENTFLGVLSGKSNTLGNDNTANGFKTLYSNTTGNFNVAFGAQALYNNTTGNLNTAVGRFALYKNTDRSNLVAIGDSALYNNGVGATPYIYQGTNNTAIGSKTLFSNTTGYNNSANGYKALYSNSSGMWNSANGVQALYFNTTGSQNTANGLQALYFNNTGVANTANGVKALYSNTQGWANTATGYMALSSNINGGFNTAIGYNANVSSGSLGNATAIGANVTVSASNNMVFGNADVIGWGFGVNPPSGKAIQIGSNTSNGNGAYLTSGGTWTNGSSRAFKDEITPLDPAEILKKISWLEIARWKYKETKEFHIGPFAEQFYELFNTGIDSTHISTIDPAGVALLGIQQLIKEKDILKSEVEELKKQNSHLLGRLEILEKKY